MLYSIIIPYKETDINMLRDCLDSLKEQTFKDFEVIFIHNGNTHLKEELKKYSFDYKVYVESKLENPQTYRNIGIRKASGEYVLFMDGDDYLHPNALIYTKRIIDESADKVIKLGVKKTHYTKSLTFKELSNNFYKPEISKRIKEFLSDVKAESMPSHDVINKLYNLDVVSHNYKEIEQDKLFDKTNYSIKSLGLLINRSFLIDNKIKFDSHNSLYGDVNFIVSVYNLVDSIKQTTIKLYFKLIHNDSVSYPSQMQQYKEVKSYYKLLAFDNALNHCPNMVMAKQIKQLAIREYLYFVCKSESFNESFRGVESTYIVLHDLLSKPSKRIDVKLRHAFEINAIKKGNYNKAYYLSKRRVNLYNTYQFLQPKNERFRKKFVQKNIFTKLPLQKNTIVYESFLGKNYSDSPKSIFEYLKSNEKYSSYKHIWIIDNKEILNDYPILKEENVTVIDRFSWKYFYYVTVAKYFILNMRQPKWLEKKKKQIILSTWHGTPLKRLVFDMENVTSASKSYKQDFYNQSRNWDYLIAANKYSETIFERAFKYPKSNILTYGYPRNDILINYQDQYKKRIIEKLKLPRNKKIILYAPTWRDDEYHGVGQYKFSLKLNLKKMQQELGDEYIVLLRMHYFISDILDISEFEGFAYDFSKYNDVNDLYIISDILITDYSSVFFDYANLKRPILFYTYDLAKYKDELRGFYINMEKDLPGPLLYNSNEVIENIKNINQVTRQYNDKYNEFYDKFCSLEDGKATQKIVRKVIK